MEHQGVRALGEGAEVRRKKENVALPTGGGKLGGNE